MGAGELDLPPGFAVVSQPEAGGDTSQLPEGFEVVDELPDGFDVVGKPLDPMDTPLHTSQPWMRSLGHAISGDWIRKWAGEQIEGDSMAGSEVTRLQSKIDRSRGIPLHALAAQDTPSALWRGVPQFGANVLAGGVSLLGAPISFITELSAMGGREVGEFMGYLWARQSLGLNPGNERPGEYSSDAAIRRAMDTGFLSWDAHKKRFVSRSAEGMRAFVQSISPAATASALAKDGERMSAFADSMFTHPIENLVAPLLAGKALGRVSVGPVKATNRSVYIDTGKIRKGEGVAVPLKNIRGEPLRLNDFGAALHDWTPKSARPYMWDSQHPEVAYVDLVNAGAYRSRSGETIAAVKRYEAAEAALKTQVAEVVDGARAEGYNITPVDVVRMFENKFRKSDKAKGYVEAQRIVEQSYLPEAEVLASRRELSTVLREAGMNADDAGVVLGYTDKLVSDHASGILSEPKGGLLGKMSLALDDSISESQIYSGIAGRLEQFRESGVLPDFVDGVMRPFAHKLRTNVFELASGRWHDWFMTEQEGGKLRWVPKNKLETKSEAMRAYTQAAHRANENFKAAVAEGAEPFAPYDLQITDFGAVERAIPYDMWQQAVRMLPEKDVAGREMVMAAIAFDPIVRVVSKPGAGPIERFLARETSRPGSPMLEMRGAMRQLQAAIADGLGVNPLVMAEHLDSYMSRAYGDMLRAEINLAETLSVEAARVVHSVRSPRFKRELSDTKSDIWLQSLIDQGRLTPELAADGTIALMSSLADRMHQWKFIWEELSKAGLASKTKPSGKAGGGWVEVMTTADAPKGKAASASPYNFMFGHLAGKWVSPYVARQLRLTSSYWKKTHPFMQMFKLFHTALNPHGYHVRNELGDTANIWWATQISPLSGKGAAARARSVLDMRDWSKTGRKSADLLEAESLGVVDLHRAESFVSGEPVGNYGNLMESVLHQAYSSKKDPIDSNAIAAKTAVYMAMNGTVPSWVKGAASITRKMRGAWGEMVTAYNEGRGPFVGDLDAALHKGQGHSHAVWTAGSKALNRFVKRVQETPVVRWTIWHENKRRLYAYKLAKRELGLKPHDAARFVKEVLHDYGDRPPGVAYWQTSPVGQIILPPFLTYMYKQAGFGYRRILNDPRHYVYHLAQKSLSAMENQRAAQEGKYEQLMDRMRFSAVSNRGADSLWFGDTQTLGQLAADLGYSRGIVDAVKGTLRDEEGNASGINNMTMVLPIRDIANLNTALSNFMPHSDPMVQLARTNPFANAFMVAADSAGRNYATGRVADASDPNSWHPTAHKAMQLLQIFAPFKSWTNTGINKILPSMRKLASGSDQLMEIDPRTGNPVHPIELTRALTPASNITPIDKIHLMKRLSEEYKAKVRELRINKARRVRNLSLFDEEDRKIRHQAELNLMFRLQFELLNFSGKLFPGSANRNSYKQLKLAWRRSSDQLQESGSTTVGSFMPESVRDTLGPLLDSVSTVMNDYEGDLEE